MVRKILFLHCNLLLPLIVGAAFYLPGTAGYLGENGILRNHLPDMLWSYALVYALILILGDSNNVILLGLVSGIWGLMMELLQLLELSPGTFDFLDVLAEFVAAFVAVGIYRFWRMQNEENETNCSSSLS